MSDDEFDFELPPLPTKPQKTLFSFFGSQQTSKKKKPAFSKNTELKENKFQHDKVQQNKNIEEPVANKKDLIICENVQEIKRVLPEKFIVASSGMAMKCVETYAPFPERNHVQQYNETCTNSIEKEHKLHTLKPEKEVELNIDDLIKKSNYSSLLSKQPVAVSKEKTNNDRKLISIEECLQIIGNSYPGFPVKKVFQQYVNCQKTRIMSNLRRMESSAKAVNSVWENDAVMLTKRKIEADTIPNIKEIAKEKNDIRSMFTKIHKKQKKKSKVSTTEESSERKENLNNTDVSVICNSKEIDQDNGSLQRNKVKNEETSIQNSNDIRSLFCTKKNKTKSKRKMKCDKEDVLNISDELSDKIVNNSSVQEKKFDTGIKAKSSKPDNSKKLKKKVTLSAILNPSRSVETIFKVEDDVHESKENNASIVSLDQSNNQLTSSKQPSPSCVNKIYDDEKSKSRKRKSNIDSNNKNKKPKTEDVIMNKETNKNRDDPIKKSINKCDHEVSEASAKSISSKESEEIKDCKENPMDNPSSRRRSSRSRKNVITYCENEIFRNLEQTSSKNPSPKQKSLKKEKVKKESEIIIKKDENEVCDTSIEIISCDVNTTKVSANNNKIQTDVDGPKVKRPVIEIDWNEDTMNSFLTWTEKYQPLKGRFVIGEKDCTRKLFDWLKQWKEKHEAFVKKMNARLSRRSAKNKMVQQQYSDDSDDWSDDEDDEDYLCNTLLVTGPVGCGSTTAVYACAKQLEYKVFELNPSMNRTGKFIVDQVSEAVMSHQVKKGFSSKTNQLTKALKDASDGTQQLSKFFGSNEKSPLKNGQTQKHRKWKSESDKDNEMSLVLFEEVDILFEDYDRGFWSGLEELQKISRRPIILTANDENITRNLSIHEEDWVEHIEMTHPSRDHILPMLQLMCLTEQVFLPRETLKDFCKPLGNDVRKIMTSLQFWLERVEKPLFSFISKSRETVFETVDLTNSESTVSKQEVVINDSFNKTSNTTQHNGETCDQMDVDSSETIDESKVVDQSETIDQNTALGQPNTSQNNDLSNEMDMDRNEVKQVENPKGNVSVDDVDKSLITNWKDIKIPCSHLPTHLSCVTEEKVFNIAQIKENMMLKAESDDLTDISRISSTLDELMDYHLIDSVCNHRDHHGDRYPWSAKITDSLSDEFPKETGSVSLYPVKEMISHGARVIEQVYNSLHGNEDNGFESILEKMDGNFIDAYTSVAERQQPSSDRNAFFMDTFPSIKTMCLSEELKKTCNTKRNNRRFLHYFDTIGMVLEDETKIWLANNHLGNNLYDKIL